MTDPLTPPPQLVQQWANACPYELDTAQWVYEQFIAARAAQWGADQELEACVQWTIDTPAYQMTPGALRAARRSKPPSLKEEASAAFEQIVRCCGDFNYFEKEVDTIRRALEALPDA